MHERRKLKWDEINFAVCRISYLPVARPTVIKPRARAHVCIDDVS